MRLSQGRALMMGGMGVLVSLLLSALAWRMGLSLSQRLGALTRTMDRLADGDLRMSA